MDERTIEDEYGRTIIIKKRMGEDSEETGEELDAEGEEMEEVLFDYEDVDAEDEDIADLSHDEAKELLRKKEEKAAQVAQMIEELRASAAQKEENGDISGALEDYKKILEYNAADVTSNVKVAVASSEYFTKVSELSVIKELYADGVEKCGDEFKSAVKELCEEKILPVREELNAKIKEIEVDFLKQQSVRREAFKKDYDLRKKNFLISIVPLVLFVLAAIICAVNIITVEGFIFLVLTCVFGALSLAAIVSTLVLTRKFLTARRRVKENEKLTSTKDGRRILALKKKVKFLNAVLTEENN